MSDEKLLLAAENGDIETIKTLITQRVDINAINDLGETSLLISTRNGYKEIVELLCENGANIFVKDEEGLNILLTAAYSSKGRFLVNYFLSKGLKFDSEIHEAGFKGDLNNIKRCINELNISVTTKDVFNSTVLLYAAFNGHLPIMQWLLTEGGSRIDEKDIIE